MQDSSFVTEQEVRDCLTRRYGSWSGQRIDSLDLHRMEEILTSSRIIRPAYKAIAKEHEYIKLDDRT